MSNNYIMRNGKKFFGGGNNANISSLLIWDINGDESTDILVDACNAGRVVYLKVSSPEELPLNADILTTDDVLLAFTRHSMYTPLDSEEEVDKYYFTAALPEGILTYVWENNNSTWEHSFIEGYGGSDDPSEGINGYSLTDENGNILVDNNRVTIITG